MTLLDLIVDLHRFTGFTIEEASYNSNQSWINFKLLNSIASPIMAIRWIRLILLLTGVLQIGTYPFSPRLSK